MAKIAMRRTVRSCAPAPLGAPACVARRLSASGITMSFDTMIASATDFDDHHRGRGGEAADEGDEGEQFGVCLERQPEHEHVAVHAAGGKRQQARGRDRHHEQIDKDEVKREQPRGAADLSLAVVLDHGNVELPRQQHDGEQRQRRHRAERAERRRMRQHRRGLRQLQRARKQRQRPGEHDEGHEDADGEKSDELDDQLGGDRHHQSVLMLGGVDVPGPEQDGEGRHQQRNEQRDVADQRLRGAACRRSLGEDGADR